MIKINILLENYSINEQYKSRHGLSVLIEYFDKYLLLDVGPDKKFAENAKIIGFDLSEVTHLFLSHNHNDHTWGLNEFIKINNNAAIYIMDNIYNNYFDKRYFFYMPIGLKLKEKYNSKIIQLSNDLSIDNKIFFMKNVITENRKPTFNKTLFKKENGKIVNDVFDHEGILVLKDNNELLIFNSCSHNGVLNIIETVKRKFPDKTIRSYVGGLHLCNPDTQDHENPEYLDYLAEKLKTMNINIYTGHCTGKFVLNYLTEKLGNMIHEINTGMELEV